MGHPETPLRLADQASKTLAAGAEEADRKAELPLASIRGLRDNGLFGLLVPTGHGGMGADLETFADVAQVLASGCLSTAMAWAMHCQQVDVLVRHASPRLAEAVLPRVADGSLYLGSVTTEPGVHGSLLSSASPVREDGDRLLISREAPIVTGGMHVDGFLVTMRSSETAADHSVSLLYADRSQLAVEPTSTWDTMGMRGTESHGLTLHGYVPDWQIVGVPGGFRQIAVESMAPVAHIAWVSCWLGSARAALSEFVSLVRSPSRPRGLDVKSELFRERLARIRIDLELVSAYLDRVIREVLDHRARGASLDAPAVQIHLNTLKVAGAELTYRSVDNLVQLAGLTLGYRKGSPLALERNLRDLRSASLNFSNDRLSTTIGALSLLDRSTTLL